MYVYYDMYNEQEAPWMSNVIYHNHQITRIQDHKLKITWQVQERHVVKVIYC